MGASAKYIMIIGGLIFLAGLIWYFLGDKLHWVGRLPGDIRIQRGNFRFYFPFTTLLLASVLVTIVINLLRKIF
jgi:hypothetical protein